MTEPRQTSTRSPTGYGNVSVAMLRNEWVQFCDFADLHGMKICVAVETAIRLWFSHARTRQVELLVESQEFDRVNKLNYIASPGLNKEVWRALCRLEYPHATHNAVLRAVLRSFVKADADTVAKFRFDTYMGTSLEFAPGVVS